MQRFSYRARDAAGTERQGSLDAADQRAAVRALMQQGLTPLETRIDAPSAGSRGGATARPGRVTSTDRQFFFAELGTLLASGISLSESLASMARAYARLSLGPSVAAIAADVNAGKGLSDAIGSRLSGVPPYAMAMVRAGEASGHLAEACNGVAAQLDYDRKVAQTLRNALVYPTILVTAGCLALVLIMVGVVPRFAGLLDSANSEVPVYSRTVIEVGIWAKRHAVDLAIGASALGLVLISLLRSPAGRRQARDVLSAAPWVGPWMQRTNMARWLTVLAALLKNRIPVVQAVALSAEALDLPRLRHSVEAIGAEIQRGGSLSDSLATRGWFPETRLNLVWVGERSGQLPTMLSTLGTLETDLAQETQKRVLALIEPVAILSIGAAIGLIMVAVMMAITSMNAVVG